MKHLKLLALSMMATTMIAGGGAAEASSLKKNPLMTSWETPHQTPPFTMIKVEHYMPAITAQLAAARANVDAIVNSSAAPTFANTIEALEYASADLEQTLSVFFNLNGSETSPEMQAIALEMSPAITEFGNDISLNDKLFARVKAVYEQREKLDLTLEQRKLLEKRYTIFVRSGANLNAEQKKQYRAISGELAELGLKFDQNLLAATNNFSVLVTDPAELSGLPESAKAAAAADALAAGRVKAGEQGWLFTLHMPSYIPVVTYADNRDLREKLWRANNSRCFTGDSLDNQAAVLRISELRLQLARLLGYNTYADYVLEERMAQNVGKVNALMGELLDKTIDKARADKATIEEYARSQGFKGEFQLWDWNYYNEKYKSQMYNLTDEMTRPYFKLENVENALFMLAGKLYGLKFVENKEIPVYHKDVKAFEVMDTNGQLLAVLYMDYFPRTTKRGGAWMSSFRDHYVLKGKEVKPIVTIVCNFTKPTADEPSLLSFNEFTTALHEFGHGLHGMLAKGNYASVGGTNVYRDFVELPSQLMENWATEKEFLDLWAVHYKTGEKMPDELIQKIIDSKQYLAAYNNVRQLSFAMNDMAWHTITEPVTIGVGEFERQATAKAQIFPIITTSSMSPTFAHVFSGGYEAGYYSYKWAETLEADAFAKFKEAGIFNRDVANSFRKNILSAGGVEHPMTIYVRFAGAEPTTEPLLKKMGVIN